MPMLERPISTAGWTRVAFGDVVRLSKARVADPEAAGIERVVGLEHIEPGDLRIRRWGDVADGTTFTTLFKPGQVLFGKRRAYQRKVAVADFEGVCSGDIYVLEPANDRLMPELLPFLCQTDAFFDHAVGTSAGSLSPRTNWTSLASFEFLLPPIQEQARLLEALVAANEVRDGLGTVADSAAMAMRSLCKTLFIEKRNEIARTRIGKVATVRNGTTPSRKNPDFWNGNVPWLPTGKVNDRYIEAADECITGLALRKCSLRLIPAGSTLVAMIGEGTTRGKAALLRIDATTNQNFAAVSPGEGIVPEFLFYQLESCYEPLRHWSHGTNQHALNTKLVSDFPIWVPHINEQKEIVAEIAALENQRVAAERRRDSFQGVYRKISEKVLEACCL
jgi:type I restriction enzyme S subunit